MSATNDGEAGEGPMSEDEKMFLKEATLNKAKALHDVAISDRLGLRNDDNELLSIAKASVALGKTSLAAIRQRYARLLDAESIHDLELVADREAAGYYQHYLRSMRGRCLSTSSQSVSDEATIPSQILLQKSTSGGSPANEMSFEMTDNSRQPQPMNSSFARGPDEDGEVGTNADPGQQDESMEEAEDERRFPNRSEGGLGHLAATHALASEESGGYNELATRQGGLSQKRPANGEPSRAARRPPRHLDYDKQPFRELFARADKHWEVGELMAADTKLLRPVLKFLDSVFDSPGNLPRLLQGASDFLRVINNLPVYNQLLAPRLGNEAKNAAEEVDLSSTRAIGAILLDCASKADRELHPDQESPDTTRIVEMKKALYRLKKGDNAMHKNYDEAISDSALHKFITVGHQTNNLIMHCLHLLWVYNVIADICLSELLADLGDKGAKLLRDAKQLAKRVNRDVPFDEDMAVLEFLRTVVSPVVDRTATTGPWVKAAQLTAELFACLNIWETPGLTLNNSASLTLDPRQKFMLDISAAAELSTVGGDSSEQETDESYFSGTGDVHSKRRLRALRTYLVMFLKEPIQRCLPADFFSKRGYTSYFLGLSPSVMKEECTFIAPTFFEIQHGTKSDIAKRIKGSVLSKKEKDGRRTIVIDSREQIDCLKRLVGATS